MNPAPMFVTRRAHPNERDATRGIIHQVYAQTPLPPDEPDLGQPLYVAVDERNQPLAACILKGAVTTFRGSTLPLACIAAVAVKPEHRGSGVGTIFMQQLLSVLRNEGFAIAALYPFRETFYRRAGFATAGDRKEFRVPVDRLPALRRELPVTQITKGEAAQHLDAVFRQFAVTHNACVLRDENEWQERLGKSGSSIYVAGEPAEGYLWVKLTDFWETATVGEMVWTTPAAHRTLLSLIRDLCINQSTAVWQEPGNSPTAHLYKDAHWTIESVRLPMYRVLNLEACLADVDSQNVAPVSIRVKDAFLPEENRTVALYPWAAPSTAPPDLSLSMETLTQGLLGDPSWSALHAAGAIEAHHPEALDRLNRILPPASVFLTEFF